MPGWGFMSKYSLVFLSCVVGGCATGAEDSGFGSFGSASASATNVTTAGSASTGDGTSDGDGTTGGADEGGTGGVDESTSGSASDGSTGNPSTSTTGNSSTTGNTTGNTTASDTTTSGGMQGMQLDVQNHDGSCEDVVWCQDNTTMEGVGPHAFAECFTNVGLAPPFDVTEVRYQVGALQNPPTVVTLEIRGWTGTARGAVIGSQALTAGDVSVGNHNIVLQTPITVNASSFCVVVDGNDAFAVGRDESNSVPNVAFVKADDCGLGTYDSLQSIGFPGNLCMSATIEN